MSNNLDGPRIASGQATNQHTTSNDADNAIDAAITEALTIVVDTTTEVLTSDQFRDYHTFIVADTGSPSVAAAITLQVPAIKRGTFWVWNETSVTVTVEISGQTKTSPTVGAGEYAPFCCDGSNVVGASASASVSASEVTNDSNVIGSTVAAALNTLNAYDFGFSFEDVPTDAATIQRVQIGRNITIPANMSGSSGTAGANPSMTYEIDVQDDGVSIGTISISTGGAFTFTTTSGTAKSVAAGSQITFVAPTIGSPSETALAGVSVVILATLAA